MAVEISSGGGGVVIVTLSTPGKQNALDEQTFRQLVDVWRKVDASPSTRCVVLTGTDGAFCSGADLSARLTSLPDVDALIDEALLKTRMFRKPIVAAISGACVAGGLELALSCDVRLTSPEARFGFPEARWGIFPAGGGAARLSAEIGYVAAAELLLTGRIFDAAEAMRLGLVNRIVSAGSVIDEAMNCAQTIARNSPAAVEAIKTYLSEARRPDARLSELELQLTRSVRASPDASEGTAAFLGKRAPQYRDVARDV